MSEIDNCKHCTFRGDIDSCNAATCNEHASWYAQTKIARIKELEQKLEASETEKCRLLGVAADLTERVEEFRDKLKSLGVKFGPDTEGE